jgi:hypothetical protein
MSEFTLFFLVSGYILWLAFGIAIIRRGFLDKRCGYPMGALCLGLPWEFMFSFIEPQIHVMTVFNRSWLILDIIILIQFIKYEKREFPTNLTPCLFLPTLIVSFCLSFSGLVCFTYQFGDLTGIYSAFIIQLVVSILFISMLIGRNSLDGQSLYAGLLRLTGTLCFDVISYLHDPQAKFLNFIYIASFIFDIIYCFLVYHMSKKQGISLWRRI